VTIEEYRPIFVNGQVEKSGAYPFQPGLTIRKAVSLAGGFKERASKEKSSSFVKTTNRKHRSRSISPPW
jgi:protein involved in polysaccharide export with SLBB domain